MPDQSLPPIIPITNKQIKDITGQRFGRLIAVGYVGSKNKKALWLCACDCGQGTVAPGKELRSGNTQSCGCLQSDNRIARNTRHGLANRPEYSAWKAMRTRCSNPNVNNYHNYGARGIKVCDRWNDFAAFLSDMGPRPTPKHTIERKDSNGNYEPSNCHWATRRAQNNNTRKNVHISCDGQTLTVSEWARRKGLGYSCLLWRITQGWSPERALNTPPKKTVSQE